MSDTLSSAFADTKPHYNILDGLRGVAALTVVCFHLFEAYATSHLDQKINHGNALSAPPGWSLKIQSPCFSSHRRPPNRQNR